jgi:inner membrane protein
MLTAHLPAGYIGGCMISDRCRESTPLRVRQWLFASFVAGNLFPDVDMLYFYTIDHHRHHHHYFWTHLPVVWFALLVATWTIALFFPPKTWAVVITAFIGGVFLHLVLDTPVGDIAWLYPYSHRLFHIITVPNEYGWWLWNFVLHWTFLFEILVWVAAVILYVQRNKRALTEPISSHDHQPPLPGVRQV